jgi:hypothetical protein
LRLQCILSLCCCVAVSGCSLNIPVKAGFEAGKLVFTTDQDRDHWCLDEFKLTDRNTGEVVWHIDPISWTGSPQFCSHDFPLPYGTTPRWMKVVVAAQPLRSGHTYEIEGTTGNQLSGAFIFKVQHAVYNVPPER